MEENTSRASDQRAPFSAPEQPAARPPRRGTPPAVTFRPPSPEPGTEGQAPQQPAEAPKPAARPRRPARTTPARPATPPAAKVPAQPARTPKVNSPAKSAAPPPASPTPPDATPAPPAKKAAKATKKAAPPRKAAQKAAPVKAETIPPAEATPPATAETVKAPDLWSKLRANPTTAPETLAAAAVERIGPQAHAWATEVRAAYPTATADGLTRLAVLRFTRSATLRATLSAFAGPYTPAALLTANLFTHAELVLHVAAAYGLDPTDPRRADDLLVLSGVKPDRGPAVQRLAGAGAAWAVFRVAGRVFPGAGLVAGLLTTRSAAEAVAVRAQRYYVSQRSQESGSSS